MKHLVTTILGLAIATTFTFGQTSVQDSLILVDLYNATNGENWTHNSHWLNGPVDTWEGVALNGFSPRRVWRITLDDNNLVGELPENLGNLTYLTLLNVADNQLSGKIPSSLGNLWGTSSMRLENNQFTDSVPAGFSNFIDVHTIDVSNNQLSWFPDMSNTSPLIIRISNNKMSFESIIPNLGAPALFNYLEQDSVLAQMNVTVAPGGNAILDATVGGGAENRYEWFKDGVSLGAASPSSIYSITDAQFGDEGVYTCSITNTLVPDLILERRPIHFYIDVATAAMGEQVEWEKVDLFPNPSENGIFHLSFGATYDSPIDYTIINNTGEIVLRSQLQGHQNRIETGIQSAGVYVIRLESEDFVTTKRIVIQ